MESQLAAASGYLKDLWHFTEGSARRRAAGALYRRVRKLTGQLVAGQEGLGARLLDLLARVASLVAREEQEEGQELPLFLVRKVERLRQALRPCLS